MSVLEPYEDGQMTVEQQGAFAPERLAGPVYSRRFVGPGGDTARFLVITEYVAPVVQDEESTVVDVECMSELTWCNDVEDPGGSEVTGHYVYQYVNELAQSPESADTMARRYCKGLSLEHYMFGSAA